MDWIQQWQSKLNKQNGVAPLVRTGGSRHTGLAALPHRNIQEYLKKTEPEYYPPVENLLDLIYEHYTENNPVEKNTDAGKAAKAKEKKPEE